MYDTTGHLNFSFIECLETIKECIDETLQIYLVKYQYSYCITKAKGVISH